MQPVLFYCKNEPVVSRELLLYKSHFVWLPLNVWLPAKPIGQLHVSENILINCLIALTSRLDARKNVLQPMGIRQSMGIKQPSQTKHTV